MKKHKRARTKKGRYKGDNKDTPFFKFGDLYLSLSDPPPSPAPCEDIIKVK